MTVRRELLRLLALLFAFALVAAACGGSSDEGGTTEDESTEDAGEDSGEDESGEATTATTGADTEVTESEEEAVYGGRVVIGLEAESTGLRPWEDTCAESCYAITGTIYDQLFGEDADSQPTPWLVESYEVSDDLLTYVMQLRDGVTFTNGKPFTAQSVADMFPIQQVATNSAGTAAGIASVEATGELEVTYTLTTPSATLPAALSRRPLGAVFDAEAYNADPAAFNENPIGTGPFTLKSRDTDNATIVERNPNYWMTDAAGNQLPYLDEVEFRPIPDEGARLDSQLSGTTDLFETRRQGTIRDARDAEVELLEIQGNNTGGGMYNMDVPPLDDVRVRRALTQLNPQEQVIEALGGTGISLPASQWFSPDSPWYSQAVADAWPQFDFEAGVAGLQEYLDDPARSDGKAAGEPIDIELSCPPDPTLIAAVQVVEQVWTSTGLINVSLTNFDQATHVNNAIGAPPDFEGSHNVHCWRWGSDADPAIGITPFVAPPDTAAAEEAQAIVPGSAPQALNVSNWWNPDAYAAAVQATQTTDFDERYALYEQIMMLIAEEVPIYYSGHTAYAVGVRPGVEGVISWHTPDGDIGNGIPSGVVNFREVFVTE